MFVYVSISPTFIVFIKTFIYCIVFFSKIHVYFVLLRELFRLFSTKGTRYVFARLNQLNGCVIKKPLLFLEKVQIYVLLRFYLTCSLSQNANSPLLNAIKVEKYYHLNYSGYPPFPSPYYTLYLYSGFPSNRIYILPSDTFNDL